MTGLVKLLRRPPRLSVLGTRLLKAARVRDRDAADNSPKNPRGSLIALALPRGHKAAEETVSCTEWSFQTDEARQWSPQETSSRCPGREIPSCEVSCHGHSRCKFGIQFRICTNHPMRLFITYLWHGMMLECPGDSDVVVESNVQSQMKATRKWALRIQERASPTQDLMTVCA